MKNFSTLLLLLNIHGVSFAQASQKLSGSDIKKTISGQKVVLATSYGSFPLRYSASKRVTGDGSELGLAKFFAPKETGKWWVRANKLCQKFPTWYSGRTFCFTLEKTGPSTLKWRRSDGFSGTATIK